MDSFILRIIVFFYVAITLSEGTLLPVLAATKAGKAAAAGGAIAGGAVAAGLAAGAIHKGAEEYWKQQLGDNTKMPKAIQDSLINGKNNQNGGQVDSKSMVRFKSYVQPKSNKNVDANVNKEVGVDANGKGGVSAKGSYSSSGSGQMSKNADANMNKEVGSNANGNAETPAGGSQSFSGSGQVSGQKNKGFGFNMNKEVGVEDSKQASGQGSGQASGSFGRGLNQIIGQTSGEASKAPSSQTSSQGPESSEEGSNDEPLGPAPGQESSDDELIIQAPYQELSEDKPLGQAPSQEPSDDEPLSQAPSQESSGDNSFEAPVGSPITMDGPVGSPSNVNGRPQSIEETIAAIKDSVTSLFFSEADLSLGKKMNLYFTKSSNEATFLPREVIEKMPFSLKTFPEILHHFNLSPDSGEAVIMKETLEYCESNKESDKCCTSLESMVDFATTKVGKQVKAISPNIGKDMKMEFKVTGIKKLTTAPKGVTCHKVPFPCAVFYCETIEDVTIYNPTLLGTDGSSINVPAICHDNTNSWDNNHWVFENLHAQPGSGPICHFLLDDDVLWIAQ